MTRLILPCLLCLLLVLPARAQDSVPATDDDVNAVASQLYCPICEHLPLDVCPEPTCIQWRAEIRARLTAGESQDEIINYFVTEYGDRVVGIPQNPLLRALSLAGPIIAVIVGLSLGVWTFLRWRGGERVAPTSGQSEDDDYRNRLESDLEY
jgi:cytochrome c-type biogenesis protein CcmH